MSEKFRPKNVEGKQYTLILSPSRSERESDIYSQTLQALTRAAISERMPCVFIQPHFDDNSLSAGGKMRELTTAGVPVSSVTVMSRFSDRLGIAPHMQILLDNAGEDSLGDLYHMRDSEDSSALAVLGVTERVDFGQLDLPFRTRIEHGPAGGKEVPLYTALRGPRAQEDEVTEEAIVGQLRALYSGDEKTMVFVPVGVGSHIDHLLVRDASISAFAGKPNVMIIYYRDIPYAMKPKYASDPLITMFLNSHQLGLAEYDDNQDDRIHSIFEYRSQLTDGLFKKFQGASGNEEVTLLPEGYYLNLVQAAQFLSTDTG